MYYDYIFFFVYRLYCCSDIVISKVLYLTYFKSTSTYHLLTSTFILTSSTSSILYGTYHETMLLEIVIRSTRIQIKQHVQSLTTEYQLRYRACSAARAHTAITNVMLNTAEPITPLTPMSSWNISRFFKKMNKYTYLLRHHYMHHSGIFLITKRANARILKFLAKPFMGHKSHIFC